VRNGGEDAVRPMLPDYYCLIMSYNELNMNLYPYRDAWFGCRYSTHTHSQPKKAPVRTWCGEGVDAGMQTDTTA
jgi:hypothetical protein